jgi:multidrug resistance protein, MATE family
MSATANLVNLALDWLFIVELGMAARGAGLATMVSQYAQLAVAVALYAVVRRRERGERRPPWLPGWSVREVFDRARLNALARLNGDILVRTICLVTAFAVFTNASSVLGTAVLAANTLLLRLLTSPPTRSTAPPSPPRAWRASSAAPGTAGASTG